MPVLPTSNQVLFKLSLLSTSISQIITMSLSSSTKPFNLYDTSDEKEKALELAIRFYNSQEGK
jgi:hypothetical protein